MKKLLALSGLALAISTPALAVEQPYLGVGVAMPTFTDDTGGDATPMVGQLRFGSDLTKYLGLQAAFSIDAGEDALAKPGVTYDFSVDSMYTLSAVLRLPVGDHSRIYGHLGYSYAQVSLDSPNVAFPSIEDNLDGMAYGLGIVFPTLFIDDLYVDIDYTSYLNGDDTLGGIGIGLRKFL